MKKSILITSILAAAVGAYAQGTVKFENFASPTLEIKVYAPQTDVPTVETTGNSSADVPSGSTIYSGGLIGGATSGTGPYFYTDGNDYSAELYAAPGDNAASSSLTPVTQYTSTFYTSSLSAAGYFKPVAPVGDPGIPNTPSATVGSATAQLYVWYNGGGTYSTYALATAAGVPVGHSAAFNIDGLGGYNNNGNITPDPTPLMTNLTSFSLTTVPEPSTIALGVIGATSFLFRRRK